MTAQDNAAATAAPLIRPAAEADLGAVAAIYAHYVDHTVVTFDETPPPVSFWRSRLDDLTARGLPFLVAEEAGGRIAGYAYASPWRPKPAYRHSVENSVYLSPERTGRGLGAALMEALVDDCSRAGVHRMIAVVADSGTAGAGPAASLAGSGTAGAGPAASLALHRRLGFAEAGRLTSVGRKHGLWLDTVLLQLDLGPGRGPGGEESAH
ncbi:GNAT family N-acetyltransferase [Streptomyces sp. NPDC012421]|uniref:GNAT family N-acetyltransferase n=1 Tax=Streptomyces sp. NPDC012421 TaxID=3364832 RepID=UPI0036EA0815